MTTQENLEEIEKRITDSGFYPYRTNPSEMEELSTDRSKMDDLFKQLILKRLRRWLNIAKERLQEININARALTSFDRVGFIMVEVSIVKGKPPLNYEKIRVMVKRAVDLVGGIEEIVKPGDFVLLKPNIVYPTTSPTCTNHEVVRAAAELVKEAKPGRVVAGESNSYELKEYGISTKRCFEDSGIAKVCEETGVEILPFEEDEWVEVEIPDAVLLKRAKIAKAALDCDVLVNLPVMKTHLDTEITMGIKNIGHGILHDDYRLMFHRGDLNQKLVDVIKKRKPELNILDATKALGGAGPGLFGVAEEWQRPFYEVNTIMASKDVAALDAVASAVMGFDPFEVPTNRLAHRQGIGCCDLKEITIKGNRIEDVKFVARRAPTRITGQLDFVEVIEGGACRHCHSSVYYQLDWLSQEGLLDKVLEKYGVITFIMGYKPPVTSIEEIKGLPIIWGECAAYSLLIPPPLRERAVFVLTCPPQNELIPTLEKIRKKVEG